MLIRPIVPEDTPARVALSRACVGYSVVTAEMLDSAPSDPAARRMRLAAEIDGELAATGIAGLDVHAAPGSASVDIKVHPAFRSRGLGAELYRRLDAHIAGLDAKRVTAHVLDDVGSGFAERRGFTVASATRVAEIDPRTVRPLPAPEGVTLRAASELPDLRAAHEVAMAFTPDIPSITPYIEPPYEEWVAARRAVMPLDLDCCFIAFVGDRPAALTLTGVVETKLVTTLTGTHPGHRGHGLARLVKSAALSAAAAKGVLHAYTFNDTANAAIIAVNEQFGYRLHTVLRSVIRE